jgi:hypothetical protein
MPTQPIPFTSLNKSVDKSLPGFSQNQIDGYWDMYEGPDGPKFVWHKRPGLTLFSDLSEAGPVDGGYYWTRQQKLVAACNGKVFRIDSAGAETDVTGTASMVARVRPSFADVAGTNLYIASGGKIGQYPAASTGAYLTDGDAPTAVKHIGTINQILVGLQSDSERFDWADSGDPTAWSSSFANNETLPDLTNSFHVANAYLYFWGQNSLEVWRDDGATFVKELQGAIQRGCIAPYSVTNINGTFYWLDDNREVVRLNGLTPEIVSAPALSRYLRTFSTFSDARGDYLKMRGKHFYVLSFPVEGKTLVFDIGLNQWYEWSYYNSILAQHEAYLGNWVAEVPDWNKTLVGDRRTGKIWDVEGTTDDGADIRTVLRTDIIDRGAPDRWKTHSSLTLIFKRADTATTPKKMLVRWRDEGSTDWHPYREAEIEAQSQTELRVNIRRCGRYKRRQWEFVMSDATQAAMLSATESFEYGR